MAASLPKTGNGDSNFALSERTPPPVAPPSQRPRYRRIVLTDCDNHVTERGNQRATVFDPDDDRGFSPRLVAQNARGAGGHTSLREPIVDCRLAQACAPPPARHGMSMGTLFWYWR